MLNSVRRPICVAWFWGSRCQLQGRSTDPPVFFYFGDRNFLQSCMKQSMLNGYSIYIYVCSENPWLCRLCQMSNVNNHWPVWLQSTGQEYMNAPTPKTCQHVCGKPWVWLYEITFARLLRWVSWVEMFDSYEQWMNIAHLWMIYHDLPINMMIFNSKTVELPEAIQSQ